MSKPAKAPVPVARCLSCGMTLTGKYAQKRHQCRSGPRINRDDALALQRKAPRS